MHRNQCLIVILSIQFNLYEKDIVKQGHFRKTFIYFAIRHMQQLLSLMKHLESIYKHRNNNKRVRYV